MKYLSDLITIIILLIPNALLSIAIIKHLPVIGIISIVLLFVLVLLMPLAKGIENIWMYVLSSITLLPLNVKISIMAYPLIYDLFDFNALAIFISIMVFFIVSNTEQIVLGLITRIIKTKQEELEIWWILKNEKAICYWTSP